MEQEMENVEIAGNAEVMLVDDSVIDNFVSQKILERYGFSNKITSYTKARKALEYLAGLLPGDNIPDIIFLDLNMPVMNGFQFLAEFNRLESYIKEKCKIIILSSTINPAEVSLAMRDHNVFAFFSKPLMKNNVDHLLALLRGESEMAY